MTMGSVASASLPKKDQLFSQACSRRKKYFKGFLLISVTVK